MCASSGPVHDGFVHSYGFAYIAVLQSLLWLKIANNVILPYLHFVAYS